MIIDKIDFKPVDLSVTNNSNDSIPRINIAAKSITFNGAFCKALDYPAFIELYVNVDYKKIAFKGLNKPSQTCRNFAKRSKGFNRKNSYVALSGKRFVSFMKNIFGVSTGRVSGKEIDGFIVFDLQKDRVVND